MSWKVWIARPSAALLWLGTLGLGCNHCFGGGALQVGGDTPYDRCLAADPPSSRSEHFGKVTLHARGHEVSLDGLPGTTTLAAFSGPGLGPAPGPVLMAALTEAKPDLALVLGDLGDSQATARATAAALAKLPYPVLFVAGARDTRERIADALSALGPKRARIIDVTTARSVRLGADTLIPVAGAADGHYALEAHGCGYGLDDLKRLAGDLGGEGRGRRWLVAWQAPASTGPAGVARDDHGVELGSPILAELARRVGAPGGIFAWPHDQLLRPSRGDQGAPLGAGSTADDLRIVVPRLTGPALERADGSRGLPGFALLRLDGHGLTWLEARANP